MAVIQSSDIGDLIRNSLNRLNKGKFTAIATDRQKYVFTNAMVRKSKVVFDSGPLFQWNVMIDHNNSAEAVGLYAVDNVNAPDVMIQAVVPWRQYTANYPIDAREITRNSGESKIVDMLLTRRKSCMISLMEKFEADAWKLPSSTDSKSMFGFPYWIVKNNTEGFNGGNPTGYTTVANIDSTAQPRWKNWTAQYVSVTKDDLVRKWRKAAEFTDWMPPVDVPDFNTGDSYGFYTNWAVLGTLAEILESQNENLGTDLAPMDGRVMFQRAAVNRIPELENDTTNPVYGINFGVFKVATESGWWMRETVVDKAANQHTVTTYHVDTSIQPHCYDRRRNFVLATNTGLPA